MCVCVPARFVSLVYTHTHTRTQDTPFVGCCYNLYFHTCVCLPPPPHPNCTTWTHGGLNLYVNKSYAASRGVTCPAPHHQLERLHHPRWYEFAGKEGGQDFDAWGYSWDSSCEAEGMGTKDSGDDFAQWLLKKGEYELKIFPRETGVAIDAIYVEGPKSWPASECVRLPRLCQYPCGHERISSCLQSLSP